MKANRTKKKKKTLYLVRTKASELVDFPGVKTHLTDDTTVGNVLTGLQGKQLKGLRGCKTGDERYCIINHH